MKRSIFFWPLVIGAAVFLVWMGLCLFVIGAPVARVTGEPGFWSPAHYLLGAAHAERLASILESVLYKLWGFAPYCLAGSGYSMEGLYGPVAISVRLGEVLPGWNHPWSCWAPLFPMSAGEVLTYVVLMPGVHFALVAFLLALVVSAATRLLFKAIGLPEGARRENGKE